MCIQGLERYTTTDSTWATETSSRDFSVTSLSDGTRVELGENESSRARGETLVPSGAIPQALTDDSGQSCVIGPSR